MIRGMASMAAAFYVGAIKMAENYYDGIATYHLISAYRR